jgi:TP901 family phage tail tape measure protein
VAGYNLGTAQGRVDIDSSSLRDADIALRSAGGGMINFGQMALGAFGSIIGTAAKFEKEMDFVQAVTNASVEEMKALEQTALDLAQKSVYGPVALSEAFVELVKAGATAEQIIGGVGEAAVNLATAADVEIPFAGENLLNILNTFTLGAEDATRVADLLAGAANASSVSLSDIVTTMRYAGPVANAMGISIEEVNTALSVLGRVGIKGSTAGTSLRFMMTRLVPDTDKAITAIKDLGLTIGDDGLVKEFTGAGGKLLDMADIMQVLQDATAGLSDQAKIAAINDIFGVRAMPSVLALMEAGKEGFLELEGAIQTTTAADVAAKRMDNLDGAIKQLKATLEAAWVEGGNPFLDGLKEFVQALTGVIKFLNKLPAPIKTFIIGAVAAIGILSLFAGAFLLTVGNIVRMVRVMKELGTAFRLFSGAARLATAANTAMSASFLLNPFTLLAAAIIAIIAGLVLLYFHFKPFRDFIDGLWQDIQKVWDKVLEFFRGLPEQIDKALDYAEEIVKQWSANVQNFFSDLWTTISGFFSRVGNEVGKVGGIFGSAWNSVAGVVGGALSAAMGAVIRFVTNFPARMGEAIGFVIGRVILWGVQLHTLFIEILGKVIELVLGWAAQLLGLITGLFQQLIATVTSWLTQLPGLFIDAFTAALGFLWGVVPQFISAAWDIGSGIIGAISGFVGDLPGKMMGWARSAWSALSGFVPSFAGTAREIGGKIVGGIVDLVTGLPGTIGGILGKVISAFTGLIGKAFDAAKNFAGGLWRGFKSGLGINSPSFIEEALFAIDAQAEATTNNLRRAVTSMQNAASSIPSMGTNINTSLPASNGMAGGMVIQGPLLAVDKLEGTQEEALSISRRLAEETYRQMAAKGKRVVLSGA